MKTAQWTRTLEELEIVEAARPVDRRRRRRGQGRRQTADKAAVVIDPGEFKRVQKELKESRKLRRESDESARYWAEQAKNGKPAPAAKGRRARGRDRPGGRTITDKGTKGLERVLDKLGFVKKKDVRRRISSTRAEITDQAAMIADVSRPQRSNFAVLQGHRENLQPAQSGSSRTWKRRRKLIANRGAAGQGRDGHDRRRPVAPIRTTTTKTPRAPTSTTRTTRTRSAWRGNPAIAAGGRRAGRPERSPSQKRLVASFAAAGADLTEEKYLKRASSGQINIGGSRAA